MAFPLLFVAALAGAQPAQAAAPSPPPASSQRPGRPFMSPMGEPVFGSAPGEDGLTAWFQQVDRNHDGLITSDEMQADADHFFQTLDTNHDGEIDPEEIAHYEQEIAPQVHARAIQMGETVVPAGVSAGPRGGGRAGGQGGRRRGASGGGGGGGGGGLSGGFGDDEASAGRFGLLQIPEPVASADADFNRGVSVEEFRRAAAQRFRLLDANHAGKLTLAELQGIQGAAASAARHSRDKLPDEGEPLDANSYTQPQ